MTIQEFIDENGLKIEVQKTDGNPNFMANEKWMKQANHYKIYIVNGEERGAKDTLETYFSMGPGNKGRPDLPTVLDCLASDASGVENAKSFEDWAAEYGYDTDSRKAEKTYRICKEQAEELKDMLGNDEYETLLWKVERL